MENIADYQLYIYIIVIHLVLNNYRDNQLYFPFQIYPKFDANVFEKLIGTCLKYYGLDPYHYFSSPGLSWDATLKITGVILEKISDIDKYLFIEKGLRGEISYIAKRYAKANTKCMNDYDP